MLKNGQHVLFKLCIHCSGKIKRLQQLESEISDHLAVYNVVNQVPHCECQEPHTIKSVNTGDNETLVDYISVRSLNSCKQLTKCEKCLAFSA